MEDHLAGDVLKTLLAEVKAADKLANRVNYQRFFKEKLASPRGLEDIGTAGLLLADGEDLVQKGYGWMLKEAGARFSPMSRSS